MVDVHTHMYTPEYIKMLESRDTIPMIRNYPGYSDPRLILLSTELEGLDSAPQASPPPGRPLTKHFSSLEQKIHYMDTHGIDVSVVSLANPWLDFVEPELAAKVAETINNDFSSMCARYPGRLYFFGTLPVSAPLDDIIASVRHLASLRYCRGVIMGTSGLGKGLDDPDLLPVFRALETATPATSATTRSNSEGSGEDSGSGSTRGLPIFLHPHYGLPTSVWGPRAAEYGHVLPLSIGFPVETTIAVARMYLAGVFDAVPGLLLLLAHSGGTLPFLAGRIESCVAHDGLVSAGDRRPRKSLKEVLRSNVCLDAVIYSDVGLKAAIETAGETRIMFGTDHPFFPPLDRDVDGVWDSVTFNTDAIAAVMNSSDEGTRRVMGGNAVDILRLD